MSQLDTLSRNPDAFSIFMAGMVGGIVVAAVVAVWLLGRRHDDDKDKP